MKADNSMNKEKQPPTIDDLAEVLKEEGHNDLADSILHAANSSQFIIGKTGTGKSFAQIVKGELISRTLPKPVIYDKENEYANMAASLGGKVIALSPRTNQHVNSFEKKQK